METGGIFDPLNFSKDGDKLDKFRAVELKHGASSLPPSLPPSLLPSLPFPSLPPSPSRVRLVEPVKWSTTSPYFPNF